MVSIYQQIEHKSGKYAGAPCDLLAYPMFEEEANDPALLHAMDEATGGVLKAVLASGEFKPELHNVCRIHNPRGLKAQRLLFVGAGKKLQFDLSRLRDVAGTSLPPPQPQQHRYRHL